MDFTVNMGSGSGTKKLSLRRSIVGSIKRSLSPLSKKSDSPTSSQTSRGSSELARDNTPALKDQYLPTRSLSSSSRFKKSNSLAPNNLVVAESPENQSSHKNQLPSNHVTPKTSKIPRSTFPSPKIGVSMQSMQSMQDIPLPKKTISNRAASKASKLRKSLSTSFCIDNKISFQELKDIGAKENSVVFPTQTTSSASPCLPDELPSTSTSHNNISSILSTQESQNDNVSLPAQASSTSGTNNQETPKSEPSTPPTNRSSIVSFQISEGVQVHPTQDDVVLTVQPPSNTSKSNRSSWLSVTRTSSTKSRKQSQPTTLQRLALGAARETSSPQRQYETPTAKETTLPWDPPFNRNWDLKADDGIPSDSDELFEQCLPPRLKKNSSPLFNLPIKVRRKIYSYCLTSSKDITVSLSPHFATKNCYYDHYFTSPWTILGPVAGGLASFGLIRDELMTYFWTEYHFHVTLTPFCNPVFTPLSSIWLPKFLDRIQHLAIEIDLTRFGCNALKFARTHGYNMEKMESNLFAIVEGLVGRRGKMAELVVLCRRFNGNRRFDENDPTWKAGDTFEYCPKEAMQFCDAIINLRGIAKSVRIAGFPLGYTKTLLKSMFGQGDELCQCTVPEISAWPPLPQLYRGPRHAPNLNAASLAPMSPELSDYREGLRTQWVYATSVHSVGSPEDNDESPARPDTSLSVTTVGDHVNLYQDLSSPITSPDTPHGSVEPLTDLIETPTSNATVTYQVMAAEDRNNSKQHTEKLNPRNSRDFSPGEFFHQPRNESELDYFSQGQQISGTELKNPIHQVSNDNWIGQKPVQTPPSVAGSHRSTSSEKEKPVPKIPNPSSKRRSQFSERQMPDIPESPIHLRTPTPAIREGTLKATSDAHKPRIHAHIKKSTSESVESSTTHPLLPTPSQTSEHESPESDHDRTIVRTPSRKSRSKVSEDSNNSSLPRSVLHNSDHDKKQLVENSIDRSRPRTPSPKSRPKAVTTTSPNTLNKINEQDPKYLASLQPFRSASNSAESVIRAPPPIHRPTSYGNPNTRSGMTPTSAPQRSFTSTEQTKRSETGQSGESGESSSKKSRFASLFRRSN